jgi:hypothetical protein
MTTITVTGQTQQIVVQEVASNVIEVLTPAAPAVVQVIAEGPQGPVRVGRVLTDATTAGTIYVGTAAGGTAESAAAWAITRSLFSAAGIRIGKGTATNVTWTGRAGHTYT